MMKKCTICGETKELDEHFHYDSATDTYRSNCKSCQSRFVVVKRIYRKRGEKLTVKEFREKKLYVR